MTELRRPEKCPACGATSFVRIIRGRPTPEAWDMIERGEAVPGGCFVFPQMPDWRCKSCQHEWLDLEDPVRQELEKAIADVVRRQQSAAKK
jgi:ribosomal protein L37AE/L43A